MIRALTDERLAGLAQAGDRDATDELMRRYEHKVLWIASNYYLPGATIDDVRQEARLGLLKAIRTFKPDRGATFSSFARLAMTAEVVTALISATRLKHRPLNESARVGTTDDGDEVVIGDFLASPFCRDPYLIVIEKEWLAAIFQRMKEMTPLERRSLMGITNGLSYQHLAAALGTHPKAIDNAAQRARLKLRDAA